MQTSDCYPSLGIQCSLFSFLERGEWHCHFLHVILCRSSGTWKAEATTHMIESYTPRSYSPKQISNYPRCHSYREGYSQTDVRALTSGSETNNKDLAHLRSSRQQINFRTKTKSLTLMIQIFKQDHFCNSENVLTIKEWTRRCDALSLWPAWRPKLLLPNL